MNKLIAVNCKHCGAYANIGSRPYWYADFDEYYVYCNNKEHTCLAVGPTAFSIKDAVIAWNNIMECKNEQTCNDNGC